MSEATPFDPFHARDTFDSGQGELGIYRLSRLQEQGIGNISNLPYSIRVLLESVLRNCDGYVVQTEDVHCLANWNAKDPGTHEIPFKPARVVLQDFTGVPAVVDLAAMRSAMQRLGGDPRKINPLIPVDLVIDHSVQVDKFANAAALSENLELEFKRNAERYEFLRWGQQAFDNFRVVPPNVGIVHQVNLEFLASVVCRSEDQKGAVAVPDTLVGTDSHTTMINGLGVVGWGVGGIEAEGVMLGQPIYMLMPEVVGFELTGSLPAGATATDLVLLVVEILREQGVVGKFVEFYGKGVRGMSLADRATLANMAPEYGATMGFFPVDEETIRYLRQTGRSEQDVELVERYTQEQGLFMTEDAPTPEYSSYVKLDLSEVVPSLAGPKRPQDRIALDDMKSAFVETMQAPIKERGFALEGASLDSTAIAELEGGQAELTHGSVVIAAITSCTNTSNPSVMIAAGLVAQNAIAKGLQVQPHVKTSLAPGSRVVSDYLDKAGLTESLNQLGFNVVGYGCTTCIGNSGPLPPPVSAAIADGDLVACSVLSGNRNFEGRVNQDVKANYLASPPLVVAYALAGTTRFDFETEALGQDGDGNDVYLKDIWPSREAVQNVLDSSIESEMFRDRYGNAFDSNQKWNDIEITPGDIYQWNENSTYIQEPPFMVDLTVDIDPVKPIEGARVLAYLGDSTTTDHISPAGAIAKDSPAGKYLLDHGVESASFNSYGSRRGNDRVMLRGTFANIRIRNQLAPGTEGGVTRYLPSGETMSIYDASMKYQSEGVPLVVLAGKEYGTGSSRDWAAKGTQLLGVRAVIATTYERIHRSNLVMMGVLPLELKEGDTHKSLGLTGEEVFDVVGLDDSLQPLSTLTVHATSEDGTVRTFEVHVRIDTPVEMDYYRNGGILQTVLRKLR